MDSDPRNTPWGSVAYRISRSRLGGVPDFHRDDAMSELYVIAWESWQKYDHEKNPEQDEEKGREGYTASVIQKRAASMQRRYGPKTKQGRYRSEWALYSGGNIDGDEMERLVGQKVAPDHDTERESTYKLLHQYIEELRPVDESTLNRYYFEGLTLAHMAELDGVTVAAESIRLRKARGRLLDLITADGLDASDLL